MWEKGEKTEREKERTVNLRSRKMGKTAVGLNFPDFPCKVCVCDSYLDASPLSREPPPGRHSTTGLMPLTAPSSRCSPASHRTAHSRLSVQVAARPINKRVSSLIGDIKQLVSCLRPPHRQLPALTRPSYSGARAPSRGQPRNQPAQYHVPAAGRSSHRNCAGEESNDNIKT